MMQAKSHTITHTTLITPHPESTDTNTHQTNIPKQTYTLWTKLQIQHNKHISSCKHIIHNHRSTLTHRLGQFLWPAFKMEAIITCVHIGPIMHRPTECIENVSLDIVTDLQLFLWIGHGQSCYAYSTARLPRYSSSLNGWHSNHIMLISILSRPPIFISHIVCSW